MAVIIKPELCKPRTADSRPAPGPLRFTSTSFIPCETAVLAASCAATVAAKAEDLRDPEKLTFPADAQETNFPDGSVIVTMVLLNEAFTCATPAGTDIFDFFLGLVATFVGVAGLFKIKNSSITSSYLQLFFAFLYVCVNSYEYAGHGQEVLYDDAIHGRNEY